MATIEILIADDHGILREGLKMVLRLEEDFQVVGEANRLPLRALRVPVTGYRCGGTGGAAGWLNLGVNVGPGNQTGRVKSSTGGCRDAGRKS